MSATYTTNTAMIKPGFNDTAWNTSLNTNSDTIDAFAAIGNLVVALRETPSTSLYVKVSAGIFSSATLSLVTYAGSAGFLLTASSTNYVYLTNAGVLTASTSAFPASNIVRLATVVTGGTTITSITDSRLPWRSMGGTAAWLPLTGGTMDDSGGVVTVGLGTTNGVKVGSSTSNKLGFWNATPIVQPSGSAQAALTNSTTGSIGTTLNDVSASFVQATLNNNFATLWNLTNGMRTALVNAGIMKGSA